MKCLHCNYPYTQVVETKHDTDTRVRRRRRCLKCTLRFTTFEFPKDNNHEDKFMRDKGIR